MESKITLIIPTHNRYKYLCRITDFYKYHKYKIFIADSSEKRFDIQLPENFYYFYYPNWTFSTKLNNIIKEVNTPYCMLCADDDFFLEETISNCIEFLEINPDYASVQGLYIKFKKNNYNTIFAPMYMHSHKMDINSPLAHERIYSLFSSYMQLQYAVHRSKTLKKFFALQSDYEVKNYNLFELLLAIVALTEGKHKIIPILFGVRESIINSAGAITDDYDKISTLPEYKIEFESFIKAASFYLSSFENISYREANEKIVTALSIYFNNNFNYKEKYTNLFRNVSSLNILLTRLYSLSKKSRIIGRRFKQRRFLNYIFKNYPKEIEGISNSIKKYPIENI